MNSLIIYISLGERKERKLIVGTVRAVRESTRNYYLIKSYVFNSYWVYISITWCTIIVHYNGQAKLKAKDRVCPSLCVVLASHCDGGTSSIMIRVTEFPPV